MCYHTVSCSNTLINILETQVTGKARLLTHIPKHLIWFKSRSASCSSRDEAGRGDSLRPTCLSEAYLSEAYLSEAYLSEAYLSEAYLSEAYLSEAYLSEASDR